jgi:hypothetical protein
LQLTFLNAENKIYFLKKQVPELGNFYLKGREERKEYNWTGITAGHQPAQPLEPACHLFVIMCEVHLLMSRLRYLRSMKYLIFIFFLISQSCFSQKIIFLKAPKGGMPEGLYVHEYIRDTSFGMMVDDSWIPCVPIEKSGDRIVRTSSDSIYLSRDELRDGQKLRKVQLGYAIVLLKNIQSMPQDTIIISGISFAKYKCEKLIRCIYEGKNEGDSAWTRKDVTPKVRAVRLRKFLPKPHIRVQGVNTDKYITVQRKIQRLMTIAHAQSPPKVWTTWYDNLEFRFVLDLCAAP